MSDNEGGTADPQDVPMAGSRGTHDDKAPDPERGQAATEKAFDTSNAPKPGPRREVSDEERDGVEGTDMTAATPLGVGESVNRSGEDVVTQEGEEPGRETTGEKDGRPVGTSDDRSATSVDPSQSGTGTDMPPGDQGG